MISYITFIISPLHNSISTNLAYEPSDAFSTVLPFILTGLNLTTGVILPNNPVVNSISTTSEYSVSSVNL